MSKDTGSVVATAGPDGKVWVKEGYEDGDGEARGHNGHRLTCDERRRPHTTRVLAKVIEVHGRRNAEVVRIVSTPQDGTSTSPNPGDVCNILPNALYPLDNVKRPWGIGSVIVMDAQLNTNNEWEKLGYTEYVVVSIHCWCCDLKKQAKYVAPPSAAEKAASLAKARITKLGDEFKAIVADAEAHNVSKGMITSDEKARTAASDFKDALAAGNEREAEVTLERFETAVTRLIPSGVSVAAMAALASELDNWLNDASAAPPEPAAEA